MNVTLRWNLGRLIGVFATLAYACCLPAISLARDTATCNLMKNFMPAMLPGEYTYEGIWGSSGAGDAVYEDGCKVAFQGDRESFIGLVTSRAADPEAAIRHASKYLGYGNGAIDNIGGTKVYWNATGREPTKLVFLMENTIVYIVIGSFPGVSTATAARTNPVYVRELARRIAARMIVNADRR